MKEYYKILVICNGNVCRSVAASRILQNWAEKNNINITVSSAGMHADAVSDKADESTEFTLKCLKRILDGANCGVHKRRQFSETILSEDRPDMILAMEDGIASQLQQYADTGYKICNFSTYSDRGAIVDIMPDQEKSEDAKQRYISQTVQKIYDAAMRFVSQLPELSDQKVFIPPSPNRQR